MMQTIQRFKRNVVYPLAAAMMLNVGCMTSHTNSRHHRTDVPSYRIEFVDSEPQTLGELSEAVESDKETIKYTKRLETIKDKIKTDPNYTSSDDLKSIVYDLEKSNLENKLQLSQQIKDFGYYKFYRIEKESRFHDNVPLITLISALVGGLVIGLYTSKDFSDAVDENDNEREQEIVRNHILGGGAFVAVSTSLFYWFAGYKKEKHHYRKTYHRPYNGTSEVIEANLDSLE